MEIHTYYDNLQVKRTASDEVIRGAYRYLSQKWHPDKHTGPSKVEAERISKLINEAYGVLSDREQRSEHDRWIAEAEAEAAAATPDTPDADAGTAPTMKAFALSAAARHRMALTVVVGSLLAAAVKSLIGLGVICFIALRFEAVRRFCGEHLNGAILGFIVWFLIGVAADLKEQHKKLLALDDDVLEARYGETTLIRQAFSIIATAFVALVAIGLFGMNIDPTVGAPEQTPVPVSKMTSPPKMTSPDATKPIASTPPPASTASVSTQAAFAPMHVTNGCPKAVTLWVTTSTAESSILRFELQANQEATLTSAGKPISYPVGDIFFYAISPEAKVVWTGDEESPEWIIDGSAQRFRKLDNPSGLLNLRCPDD